MNENSLAHARYWRNSLADAELGTGALHPIDVTGFLQIKRSELAIGLVPTSVIDKCFQGESSKIQAVQVVIRPKVYLSRFEHAKRRSAGAPDIVTPLITRALLARNGRLYPTSFTVVPRDLLEPLEHNSFAIGTVGDQDEFLTKNSVPGIPLGDHPYESRTACFAQQWSQYSEGCEQLFGHVGQGWPSSEDHFELAEFGYLVKEDLKNGSRQHIVALYERLVAASPSVPLFERYADGQAYDIEPCLPAHSHFSARLGHPSDTFPLSQGQRDALTHMLVAEPGEILAVNGPPGTGKTTLLLSVVATLWAEAALKGGEPPIIVAASSNNQPVTNIIDAFGKDFSEGTGCFANRWLPEIKSFGAYYPSHNKEAEQGKKYQTRSFFDRVESVEYVAEAERDYLQAGARAFTDLPAELLSLVTIVARLHQAIRLEAEKLQLIEDAWSAVAAAKKAVREELGENPIAALELRRQQLATSEKEEDVFKRLADQWAEYLANEPIV